MLGQSRELQNFRISCIQNLMQCFMQNKFLIEQMEFEKQKERILQLAESKFDDKNNVHLQLLQSLYITCINNSNFRFEEIQRFGSHWENLGFQGNDPITDLRCGGILGLIQLHFLFFHDDKNARKIFEYAQHAHHGFPFSVLGINITKWSLSALKSQKYSRKFLGSKNCGNLVQGFNLFYCGAFYEFFRQWVEGECTMDKAGFVIKRVGDYVQKNVNKTIGISKVKF
eukprot:TRINITY_DN18451_c0_g1_i2.p1 TRINITY_DN18451_c0_g1~~TRINITY_DN18451_c0_g1_i2.p1  ORF type:complete len:227 (+),score=20.65 TRINITY_DN18451_c0_g1_i2:255-935(+)